MSIERAVAGFWLTWLLTFVAFPAGGGLAYALVRSVDGVADGAIAGAVTGAVIGIAQWFALRRSVPIDAWWIAASSLGMAAGLALGIAVMGTGTGGQELALRGAITGAAVGLAQWLILREHAAGAGWWALAVPLAWALGWTVTRAFGVDLSYGWAVFGSSGAIVFAALTGGVLMLLL
jgi:hypothetical protein